MCIDRERERDRREEMEVKREGGEVTETESGRREAAEKEVNETEE